MGVNMFTDWSKEEFFERRLRRGKKRHYKGFNSNSINTYKNFTSTRNNNIGDSNNVSGNTPDSVDWRTKKNVLTPIRDQGDCGSCWAFSVAETMESRAALASDQRELKQLSAQQVT